MVCERDDEVKLFVDNAKTDLIVTVLYKGEDSEQSESEENDEENVIDVCGINVGEWVVVEYDGKKYPGKVTSKGEAGLQVSVMKPCFPSGWSWPSQKDEIYYNHNDIIKRIDPPIPKNNRGQWKFAQNL